ncbi:MAG: hypothetical protein H0X38_06870, partial [Planctomycetes bacterium]|nr:hypothetical protein [Planctomycetota bacterium]
LKLPAGQPRRAMLLAAAAPVQWRLLGASFVPLAVLLGPMIMSVCWLMDRCDHPNERPGVEVTLRVQVDGDATAPLTMSADDGILLDEQTPATQSLPPIRATLDGLRQRWARAEPPAADTPWEVRAAALGARAATLADLDAYLAAPLEQRLLVWKVTTPPTAGRHLVRIATGNPPQVVEVPLVLGDASPGEPLTFVPSGKFQGWRQIISWNHQPIHQVMVVAGDPGKSAASAGSTAFFQPFRALGWQWDGGWIGLYLLAYLPAMFAARRLLRVA